MTQCWVSEATSQKELKPSKVIPPTDHTWLGNQKRPLNTYLVCLVYIIYHSFSTTHYSLLVDPTLIVSIWPSFLSFPILVTQNIVNEWWELRTTFWCFQILSYELSDILVITYDECDPHLTYLSHYQWLFLFSSCHFFLSTLFSSFFLHQSYFLYNDLGCRSRDLYVDVFGFGWVYWCGCGLRLGLWWRWVCVAVGSFFFLWVWLIMWVLLINAFFLLRFMWVAMFVCNLWSSSFIAMAGSSFWYKSHQLMRSELRKKIGNYLLWELSHKLWVISYENWDINYEIWVRWEPNCQCQMWPTWWQMKTQTTWYLLEP